MNKKDYKNYYEILGVASDASTAEIEKAYRNLALKWHPNLYASKSPEERQQAEEKMKKISEAYEVLGNKEKRKNYDRYGSAEGFDPRTGSAEGQDPDFSDLFQNIFDIFGGDEKSFRREKNSRSRTRKQSITISLTLSFKESIWGGQKEITLSDCSSCQGSGVVNVTQQTVFGYFRTQITCSHCQGNGEIATEGHGKNSIILDIPRGLQLNEKIAFRDEKNQRIIYVNYKFKENPYFRRKGNDIHVNLPISFLDAILGNKVKVITLEKDPLERIKEIKIPPGSQNGDCLILANHGCFLGTNKSVRGDLYVWLQVKLPPKEKLSPSTERILRELQETRKWNPNHEFVEKNEKILDK